MNSSQLEEAYRKEAELITYKIALGELSQEEGNFLIEKARAHSMRELARLKRPSRIYFFIFIFLFVSVFVYCFFEQFQHNNIENFSQLFLMGMGFSLIGFMALFHMEFRRLESSFGRYFSKSYFHKILYAPKIAFEWKKAEMAQIHLHIKNGTHVFAGLMEEELFELRSHILTMVSDVFDDGYGVIEQVGAESFIIDYYMDGKGPDLTAIMKKIERLFADLRARDGELFSKSVRMGAGLVRGTFRSGNVGFGLQVFRTFGRKTQIADALVGAAGWEEIYIDEDTFCELEKYIYVQECEPIFLKLSKELVKVFRVTGWKDKQ
jgi:hypothetical protein